MRAFFLGALMCALCNSSFANWSYERGRIEFLLNSIENLQATFIRNGTDYDAHTAAQHLRSKLKMALQGAGGEPNYTAEDFIEQIASKSMLTGSPYRIRFPDGQEIPAHDWLYQKLQAYPSN